MGAGASLPTALLWLLPVFFLLHDAEETVRLPAWLKRNEALLMQRFGFLARWLLPHMVRLSTGRFAWMAAEELVILIGAAAYASLAGDCRPWLALFLAFGLHLLVHGVQCVAAGGRVPIVATTLAGLAYWVWGLHAVNASRMFSVRATILCAAAGCASATLNLAVLHLVAARLERGMR